jgi:hypothetical protein
VSTLEQREEFLLLLPFLIFVAVRCGEAGLTSELVFGSVKNRKFLSQAYRDVFKAGPDKQVLAAGSPKGRVIALARDRDVYEADPQGCGECRSSREH